MPVELDRDWFDYLALVVNTMAALVGAVAVVLAVMAYRAAKKANELAEKQGRESRELVAHERRVTFELEVLRDLVELVGTAEVFSNLQRWGSFAVHEAVGARRRLLPPGELPNWEKLWGLSLAEMVEQYGGEQQDAAQAASAVTHLLIEDVEKAIDVRIKDTVWHRM